MEVCNRHKMARLNWHEKLYSICRRTRIRVWV